MNHEIVSLIEKKGETSRLYRLKPVGKADLDAVEQVLGLRFAEDYRAYAMHFGTAAVSGMELTGVRTDRESSVVRETKAARERYNIPMNMYVLEDIGMDGVLVLQDQSGAVYSTASGNAVKCIAASFAEYAKKRLDL